MPGQMKSEQQNIVIQISTVLHILRGVAAATKISNELLNLISQRISDHTFPVYRKENGCSRVPEDAISLHDLRKAIIFPSTKQYQGAQQLLDLTIGIIILRGKSRHELNASTADVTLAWNLVHGALINKYSTNLNFTASRSAQGFLAVPLCSLLKDGRIVELFRFHVWLPDGNRGKPEVAIHSHQTFAQSWILAGEGYDCTFNVEATSDRSVATHALYTPRWNDDKETKGPYKTHQISSTVTNTGNLVRISPSSKKAHSRDMSYCVSQGVYHLSGIPPDKFHATIFYFDSHRGFSEDAAVVGPINGQDFTQLRDPAGVTPSALAEMADAIRLLEDDNLDRSDKGIENSTVMAYWRFFQGRALLRSGQRVHALKLFNSSEGSGGLTTLHIFCKNFLDKHIDYISDLLDAGVSVDVMDDEGYTPLDYAALNGNATAMSLIQDGVRKRRKGTCNFVESVS